jgi:uncharacterized protein
VVHLRQFDGGAEPSPAVGFVPVDRPVLRMRWEELTYLHWDLDPDLVAARLPMGLEPDVHAGRAYVGLVPFRMARIGLGPAGVPLPQGRFPETNVRTYVVGPDGGRGVYFHSLDVTRLAPTVVARTTYRLPYCWSRMGIAWRGERVAYRAWRRWPGPRGASSHVVVEVGARLAASERAPLDEFLSARWSLYEALPGGAIVRARVDHEPWPLRNARLVHLADDFVRAAGYPPLPGPPSHVRYGGEVTVRVGPPRRVA